MDLSGNANLRVIVLGGVVAVLATVAVLVLVVLPGDSGESARPSEWDPAAAELAQWVETARGLPFASPVQIDRVDDDEFAAAVGADEPADADVTAAEGTLTLLRALGLATESDDDRDVAVEAARLVLDGGATVRYLPTEGRIVVRAPSLDSLDQDTEAALVAALGTALHHQHFGIADRSQFDRSTAAAGRRALSTGVGSALADRYVLEVQERDLREWRLAQLRRRDAGAASLVADLSLLTGDLGRPLVQVAIHDPAPGEGQSWAQVDALLSSPPRTELELLQPWAAIDGFERVEVPAPDVGDHEVLSTGDFGAATFYFVAALRADPREALAAALTWAGDTAVLSRDPDGRSCVAIALAGVDGDASDQIEGVLTDWVRGGPSSAGATVDREARIVTLRSCEARSGDDGGVALDPASVIAVPVSRTDLIAELRADGRRRENAVCVADRVLAGIPVVALTDEERPPEAENLYQLLRDESDQACRRV